MHVGSWHVMARLRVCLSVRLAAWTYVCMHAIGMAAHPSRFHARTYVSAPCMIAERPSFLKNGGVSDWLNSKGGCLYDGGVALGAQNDRAVYTGVYLP
mmetsp:Transcript_48922/g.122582  ORF Transcript_48922/g.122582 Transcript_48922/m.122582 type:complete len:98 (+) Transcript_48922:460-753(+)